MFRKDQHPVGSVIRTLSSGKDFVTSNFDHFRRHFGCLVDGPRGAVGVCSGCVGFGVCELVTRGLFVAWYPLEGCRARSGVEEWS